MADVEDAASCTSSDKRPLMANRHSSKQKSEGILQKNRLKYLSLRTLWSQKCLFWFLRVSRVQRLQRSQVQLQSQVRLGETLDTFPYQDPCSNAWSSSLYPSAIRKRPPNWICRRSRNLLPRDPTRARASSVQKSRRMSPWRSRCSNREIWESVLMSLQCKY